MKRSLLLSLLLAACLLLGGLTSASAQEPTVRAVLFYSPTCPHCEYVLTEVFPPLAEHYGDQLQIVAINTSTLEGHNLHAAAITYYAIPPDRQGVPTLIVGDTILVGSSEIPAQFPVLIEEHLAAGGVEWPDLPELAGAISEIYPPETEPQAEAARTGSSAAAQPSGIAGPIQEIEHQPTALDRFRQDVFGNGLSVLVLIGMLVSLGYTAIRFLLLSLNRIGEQTVPRGKAVVVTALALLGLGVACYLAYVETTQTEAICGPVGDCNTVQQSSYARLFGFLPIGVLGAAGYVLLLLGWLIRVRAVKAIHDWAGLTVFGMALLGTLFSIYLTFLEPFVIGATCAWCLTSAVVMTSILVLTVDIGAAGLIGIAGGGQSQSRFTAGRLPRRIADG